MREWHPTKERSGRSQWRGGHWGQRCAERQNPAQRPTAVGRGHETPRERERRRRKWKKKQRREGGTVDESRTS